jgi:hypothetical protein
MELSTEADFLTELVTKNNGRSCAVNDIRFSRYHSYAPRNEFALLPPRSFAQRSGSGAPI